jgi:hypothetical protein
LRLADQALADADERLSDGPPNGATWLAGDQAGLGRSAKFLVSDGVGQVQGQRV